MSNKRHLLFLSDVVWFTLTAFGGGHAHLAMMLKNFVVKRRYISEEELLELNALTNILPGPSSTQTLIGLAYKVGGLGLAILTFLIWILPSAMIMSLAVLFYGLVDQEARLSKVAGIIQPIAVGFVAYATYVLGKTILKSSTARGLALASLIATLILQNAYAFPLLILLGGIISSAIESHEEESQLRVKLFSNVNPRKIAYFLGVLLFFALLGALINRTSPFSLPIRLFENFYRNRIMIFGGGSVLVSFMFTEFVGMKAYLTADQFLSGYAIQQALPGPTFAFSSFVGGMTLHNAGYGTAGQILGSFIAVMGINLPGVILILFIVPFWEDLKKITRIKNSLSGIMAVSLGFMAAAFFLLLEPLGFHWQPLLIVAATFLIMHYTRIKTPVLILAGILLGLLI